MPVLSNAKHEKFAGLLAQGVAAEEAYRKAGYAPSLKNAQRLKANEGIRSRVEEILSKAAEKVGVSVERITRELEAIGFADITEAVEWGEGIAVKGEGGDYIVQGVLLKPSAELPKRVSAAIAEVAKTKEGIRIKFHDKRGALEKLGMQLGMFKNQVEHSGTITLADLVRASYETKTDGT